MGAAEQHTCELILNYLELKVLGDSGGNTMMTRINQQQLF